MIRAETLTAATERIRAFEDGAKPTAAERKALFLLAAGGRLFSPKKTSLGAAADHAAARRRQEEKDEVQAKIDMHEACFAWNRANTADRFAPHGRCDCGCGYAFRHANEGECDHWIELSQGGENTRENGWRLRAECHFEKTNERPPMDVGPLRIAPRAIWNMRRADYCRRAGIPFMPRREK